MKKPSILAALAISALSINLAFAAPQDASNQIKENSVQMLKILQQANGKKRRCRAQTSRKLRPALF